MRTPAALLAVVAVCIFGATPVDARVRCKKAAPAAVELIPAGFGFALRDAKQIKAPNTDSQVHKVYFVAGRIDGGEADGEIGVWARVVSIPGTNGLFVPLDDAAKTATPELGSDLDPSAITDLSSPRLDRVVSCASK